MITASIEKAENPECPVCAGTGFVFIGREDGGESVRRCECLKRRIAEQRFARLLAASRVEEHTHMTLAQYTPQCQAQAQALKAVMAGHQGYYFFGPWGTGKTHLLAGTVVRAIEMGVLSAFVTVPGFLDILRRAGREGTDDVERLAHRVAYLALDDIGKQRDTDWVSERLYLLIDERYKLFRAGAGHTSFSSNIPLDRLADRIDGAIVDRIYGMCKEVFVDGKSYRRQP